MATKGSIIKRLYQYKGLFSLWLFSVVLIGSMFYAATVWFSVVAAKERGTQIQRDIVATVQRDIAEGNAFSIGSTLYRLKTSGQIEHGELIVIDGQGNRSSIFRTFSDLSTDHFIRLNINSLLCSMPGKAEYTSNDMVEIAGVIHSNENASGCYVLLLVAQLPSDLIELRHYLVIIFGTLLLPILSCLIGYVWWSRNKLAAAETKIKDANLAREAAIAKTSQNIAHDLNNPINNIQLALDDLLSRYPQESQLNLVKASLLRLRYMIEKFKRSDIEGIIKQQWQEIDWARLITEMEPIAKEFGVSIQLNYLQPLIIHVDVDKIERAVLNLLRNAIESGATDVVLTVEAFGTHLAITISDNGAGVPDHILDRLFERGITSGKQGGTGFGLNFVQEIAGGHGGKATHMKEKGLTKFKIDIPGVVRQEQTEHLDEKDTTVATTTIQSSEQKDLEGDRVCKVTIKISDHSLEKQVLTRLKKEFPSVVFADDLEQSMFLWSDINTELKAALMKKVPAYGLSKSHDSDKIYTLIFDKLTYMFRDRI